MSVKETDRIDAMGVDEKTNTLVLLVIDPYTWMIQEMDHILTLQKKINNYVGYIEGRGYAEKYPDRQFDGFRIEVAFRYQYSDNCRQVLEAGSQQLRDRGIDFAYSIVTTDE